MKFIRMFLFNSFIVIVLLFGYYYPSYMFYVESFSWILTILMLISVLGSLGSEKIFNDVFESLKDKKFFYRAVDWFFDFIIVFGFMILQLKGLFVVFMVSLMFKMAVRIKVKETLKGDK